MVGNVEAGKKNLDIVKPPGTREAAIEALGTLRLR
jgi:hypothetical protein